MNIKGNFTQALVSQALADEVEFSDHVRVDSTVIETNIHAPSDSSLLCDGIRVLTRLTAKAKSSLDVQGIAFTDNRKPARSLAREIFYTRGVAKKKPLYTMLLSQAEQVIKDSGAALWRVELYRFHGVDHVQWVDQVKQYRQPDGCQGSGIGGSSLPEKEGIVGSRHDQFGKGVQEIVRLPYRD